MEFLCVLTKVGLQEMEPIDLRPFVWVCSINLCHFDYVVSKQFLVFMSCSFLPNNLVMKCWGWKTCSIKAQICLNTTKTIHAIEVLSLLVVEHNSLSNFSMRVEFCCHSIVVEHDSLIYFYMWKMNFVAILLLCLGIPLTT